MSFDFRYNSPFQSKGKVEKASITEEEFEVDVPLSFQKNTSLPKANNRDFLIDIEDGEYEVEERKYSFPDNEKLKEFLNFLPAGNDNELMTSLNVLNDLIKEKNKDVETSRNAYGNQARNAIFDPMLGTTFGRMGLGSPIDEKSEFEKNLDQLRLLSEQKKKILERFKPIPAEERKNVFEEAINEVTWEGVKEKYGPKYANKVITSEFDEKWQEKERFTIEQTKNAPALDPSKFRFTYAIQEAKIPMTFDAISRKEVSDMLVYLSRDNNYTKGDYKKREQIFTDYAKKLAKEKYPDNEEQRKKAENELFNSYVKFAYFNYHPELSWMDLIYKYNLPLEQAMEAAKQGDEKGILKEFEEQSLLGLSVHGLKKFAEITDERTDELQQLLYNIEAAQRKPRHRPLGGGYLGTDVGQLAPQVFESELANISLIKEFSKQLMKIPEEKSVSGFFGKSGMGYTPLPDHITVGIKPMIESLRVNSLMNKIRDGEDLDVVEREALLTHAMLGDAVAQETFSKMAQMGQGVADMVPYIAMFAATSGVYSGVRAGTTAGINQLGKKLMSDQIRKKIIAKTSYSYLNAAGKKVTTSLPEMAVANLSRISGATAQTLAMPQFYIENISKRLMDDYNVMYNAEADEIMMLLGKERDPLGKAIRRGMWEHFSEVVTERAGPYIMAGFKKTGKVLTSPITKTKTAQKVLKGVGEISDKISDKMNIGDYSKVRLLKDWMRVKGFNTWKESRDHIVKNKMGWNGIFEEYMEEFVNYWMAGSFTRDEKGKLKLYDFSEHDWDKWLDEQIVTAGTVAIFGGAMGAIQFGTEMRIGPNTKLNYRIGDKFHTVKIPNRIFDEIGEHISADQIDQNAISRIISKNLKEKKIDGKQAQALFALLTDKTTKQIAKNIVNAEKGRKEKREGKEEYAPIELTTPEDMINEITSVDSDIKKEQKEYSEKRSDLVKKEAVLENSIKTKEKKEEKTHEDRREINSLKRQRGQIRTQISNLDKSHNSKMTNFEKARLKEYDKIREDKERTEELFNAEIQDYEKRTEILDNKINAVGEKLKNDKLPTEEKQSLNRQLSTLKGQKTRLWNEHQKRIVKLKKASSLDSSPVRNNPKMTAEEIAEVETHNKKITEQFPDLAELGLLETDDLTGQMEAPTIEHLKAQYERVLKVLKSIMNLDVQEYDEIGQRVNISMAEEKLLDKKAVLEKYLHVENEHQLIPWEDKLPSEKWAQLAHEMAQGKIEAVQIEYNTHDAFNIILPDGRKVKGYYNKTLNKNERAAVVEAITNNQEFQLQYYKKEEWNPEDKFKDRQGIPYGDKISVILKGKNIGSVEITNDWAINQEKQKVESAKNRASEAVLNFFGKLAETEEKTSYAEEKAEIERRKKDDIAELEKELEIERAESYRGETFAFDVGWTNERDQTGDKYHQGVTIDEIEITRSGDYHIKGTNTVNGKLYNMWVDPDGTVLRYERKGGVFEGDTTDIIFFPPPNVAEEEKRFKEIENKYAEELRILEQKYRDNPAQMGMPTPLWLKDKEKAKQLLDALKEMLDAIGQYSKLSIDRLIKILKQSIKEQTKLDPELRKVLLLAADEFNKEITNFVIARRLQAKGYVVKIEKKFESGQITYESMNKSHWSESEKVQAHLRAYSKLWREISLQTGIQRERIESEFIRFAQSENWSEVVNEETKNEFLDSKIGDDIALNSILTSLQAIKYSDFVSMLAFYTNIRVLKHQKLIVGTNNIVVSELSTGLRYEEFVDTFISNVKEYSYTIGDKTYRGYEAVKLKFQQHIKERIKREYKIKLLMETQGNLNARNILRKEQHEQDLLLLQDITGIPKSVWNSYFENKRTLEKEAIVSKDGRKKTRFGTYEQLLEEDTYNVKTDNRGNVLATYIKMHSNLVFNLLQTIKDGKYDTTLDQFEQKLNDYFLKGKYYAKEEKGQSVFSNIYKLATSLDEPSNYSLSAIDVKGDRVPLIVQYSMIMKLADEISQDPRSNRLIDYYKEKGESMKIIILNGMVNREKDGTGMNSKEMSVADVTLANIFFFTEGTDSYIGNLGQFGDKHQLYYAEMPKTEMPTDEQIEELKQKFSDFDKAVDFIYRKILLREAQKFNSAAKEYEGVGNEKLKNLATHFVYNYALNMEAALHTFNGDVAQYENSLVKMVKRAGSSNSPGYRLNPYIPGGVGLTYNNVILDDKIVFDGLEEEIADGVVFMSGEMAQKVAISMGSIYNKLDQYGGVLSSTKALVSFIDKKSDTRALMKGNWLNVDLLAAAMPGSVYAEIAKLMQENKLDTLSFKSTTKLIEKKGKILSAFTNKGKLKEGFSLKKEDILQRNTDDIFIQQDLRHQPDAVEANQAAQLLSNILVLPRASQVVLAIAQLRAKLVNNFLNEFNAMSKTEMTEQKMKWFEEKLKDEKDREVLELIKLGVTVHDPIIANLIRAKLANKAQDMALDFKMMRSTTQEIPDIDGQLEGFRLSSDGQHYLLPECAIGDSNARIHDNRFVNNSKTRDEAVKNAINYVQKNKNEYEDLFDQEGNLMTWEIEDRDGVIPGEPVMLTRVPADHPHSHTIARVKFRLPGNFSMIDKNSRRQSGSDFDGDMRFVTHFYKDKQNTIRIVKDPQTQKALANSVLYNLMLDYMDPANNAYITAPINTKEFDSIADEYKNSRNTNPLDPQSMFDSRNDNMVGVKLKGILTDVNTLYSILSYIGLGLKRKESVSLQKPVIDHVMFYEMPAGENLTGKKTTTIALAESGQRTATTRSYPLGDIGDIITFEGRPQKYRITDVEELTEENVNNPEWIKRWSQKEQWTIGHFKKVFGSKTVHIGSFQTSFEKVEESFAQKVFKDYESFKTEFLSEETNLFSLDIPLSTEQRKAARNNLINGKETKQAAVLEKFLKDSYEEGRIPLIVIPAGGLTVKSSVNIDKGKEGIVLNRFVSDKYGAMKMAFVNLQNMAFDNAADPKLEAMGVNEHTVMMFTAMLAMDQGLDSRNFNSYDEHAVAIKKAIEKLSAFFNSELLKVYTEYMRIASSESSEKTIKTVNLDLVKDYPQYKAEIEQLRELQKYGNALRQLSQFIKLSREIPTNIVDFIQAKQLYNGIINNRGGNEALELFDTSIFLDKHGKLKPLFESAEQVITLGENVIYSDAVEYTPVMRNIFEKVYRILRSINKTKATKVLFFKTNQLKSLSRSANNVVRLFALNPELPFTQIEMRLVERLQQLQKEFPNNAFLNSIMVHKRYSRRNPEIILDVNLQQTRISEEKLRKIQNDFDTIEDEPFKDMIYIYTLQKHGGSTSTMKGSYFSLIGLRHRAKISQKISNQMNMMEDPFSMHAVKKYDMMQWILRSAWESDIRNLADIKKENPDIPDIKAIPFFGFPIDLDVITAIIEAEDGKEYIQIGQEMGWRYTYIKPNGEQATEDLLKNYIEKRSGENFTGRFSDFKNYLEKLKDEYIKKAESDFKENNPLSSDQVRNMLEHDALQEALASEDPALLEFITNKLLEEYPTVQFFTSYDAFKEFVEKWGGSMMDVSTFAIGHAFKNAVYINPEKARQSTAAHEYTHIYWDALSEIENGIKERLRNFYQENHPDGDVLFGDALDEMIVTDIGRLVTNRAEIEFRGTIWEKFLQLVKDFWAEVKNALGFASQKDLMNIISKHVWNNQEGVFNTPFGGNTKVWNMILNKDGDLKFEEAGHIHYINGEQVVSVTGIIQKTKTTMFDETRQASDNAKKQASEAREITKQRLPDGFIEQEIEDLQTKYKTASKRGDIVHKIAEYVFQYKEIPQELKSGFARESVAQHLIARMKNIRDTIREIWPNAVFKAEQQIAMPENKVAGFVDLIVDIGKNDEGNSQLIILDFKTSETALITQRADTTDKYTAVHGRRRGVAQTVPLSKEGDYKLQLHMYKEMLESQDDGSGKKNVVVAMFIVPIHLILNDKNLMQQAEIMRVKRAAPKLLDDSWMGKQITLSGKKDLKNEIGWHEYDPKEQIPSKAAKALLQENKQATEKSQEEYERYRDMLRSYGFYDYAIDEMIKAHTYLSFFMGNLADISSFDISERRQSGLVFLKNKWFELGYKKEDLKSLSFEKLFYAAMNDIRPEDLSKNFATFTLRSNYIKQYDKSVPKGWYKFVMNFEGKPFDDKKPITVYDAELGELAKGDTVYLDYTFEMESNVQKTVFYKYSVVELDSLKGRLIIEDSDGTRKVIRFKKGETILKQHEGKVPDGIKIQNEFTPRTYYNKHEIEEEHFVGKKGKEIAKAQNVISEGKGSLEEWNHYKHSLYKVWDFFNQFDTVEKFFEWAENKTAIENVYEERLRGSHSDVVGELSAFLGEMLVDHWLAEGIREENKNGLAQFMPLTMQFYYMLTMDPESLFKDFKQSSSPGWTRFFMSPEFMQGDYIPFTMLYQDLSKKIRDITTSRYDNNSIINELYSYIEPIQEELVTEMYGRLYWLTPAEAKRKGYDDKVIKFLTHVIEQHKKYNHQYRIHLEAEEVLDKDIMIYGQNERVPVAMVSMSKKELQDRYGKFARSMEEFLHEQPYDNEVITLKERVRESGVVKWKDVMIKKDDGTEVPLKARFKDIKEEYLKGNMSKEKLKEFFGTRYQRFISRAIYIRVFTRNTGSLYNYYKQTAILQHNEAKTRSAKGLTATKARRLPSIRQVNPLYASKKYVAAEQKQIDGLIYNHHMKSFLAPVDYIISKYRQFNSIKDSSKYRDSSIAKYIQTQLDNTLFGEAAVYGYDKEYRELIKMMVRWSSLTVMAWGVNVQLFNFGIGYINNMTYEPKAFMTGLARLGGFDFGKKKMDFEQFYKNWRKAFLILKRFGLANMVEETKFEEIDKYYNQLVKLPVGEKLENWGYLFLEYAEKMIQIPIFTGMMTQEEWNAYDFNGRVINEQNQLNAVRADELTRRVAYIHGFYGKQQQSPVSATPEGHAGFQFKKWMLSLAFKFKRQHHFDRGYQIKSGLIDSYIMAFKLARLFGVKESKRMEYIKEKLKDMPVEKLPFAIRGLSDFYGVIIKEIANKDAVTLANTWKAIPRNDKRNLLTVPILLSISTLLMLMWGGGDDPWETRKEKLKKAFMMRFLGDMYYFFERDNIEHFISNPFAVFGIMTNMMKFFNDFFLFISGDQKGFYQDDDIFWYKGMPKFLLSMSYVMPFGSGLRDAYKKLYGEILKQRTALGPSGEYVVLNENKQLELVNELRATDTVLSEYELRESFRSKKIKEQFTKALIWEALESSGMDPEEYYMTQELVSITSARVGKIKDLAELIYFMNEHEDPDSELNRALKMYKENEDKIKRAERKAKKTTTRQARKQIRELQGY